MKFLMLLFSFSYIDAFAQQAVVANEKMNIVYYGVDNHLLVNAAGYPVKAVILTTESGSIKKFRDGEFFYKPNLIGEVELLVWVKTKSDKKLVEKVHYRVKQLPDPVAFTGPVSILGPYVDKDTISLSNFGILKGVRAFVKDSDYEFNFQISSFTVSVMRDNKPILILLNNGPVYNDDVKAAFKKLKAKDILSITDIKGDGSDGLKRVLAPINLFITE